MIREIIMEFYEKFNRIFRDLQEIFQKFVEIVKQTFLTNNIDKNFNSKMY